MSEVLQLLAHRPRTYLLQFLELIQKHDVEAVYLFGSQIKGYSTDMSDIDIFVIVPDNISKEKLKQFNTAIERLEEQHGYRKSRTVMQRFLSAVNRRTGTFQCHYLWKKDDFLNGRLHKIDGVIPFSLLSPSSLILSSVFSQMKLIHGNELRSHTKKFTPKKTDLLKTLVVNLLLSIAQIPFALVSNQATKYSMEAIKWTLYSCGAVDDVRETKLKEVAMVYADYFTPRYLDDMFALRENYKKSWRFTFATPYYVLKLHCLRLLGL